MTDSSDILARSVVKGRAFDGRKLAVTDLVRLGLEPERSVIVDGVTIYLSSRYLTSAGTLGCVAYAPQPADNSFTVRTYFLSKSQGVWRLLRRYRYEVRDGHEVPIWNDKGFGEESLFLPIEMQKALSEAPPINLAEPDDLLVMYGTAVDLKTDDDYWLEVERDPIILAGSLSDPVRGRKVPPVDVGLTSPEDEPDFSRLAMTWETTLPAFGATTARVYASKNQAYSFLFMTDDRGRSWLAGVDNTSVITSTGLRKRWVKVSDLATPAWEYLTDQIDQTGGYGNPDMRLEAYVDMYKNYLSHIKLVQAFERSLLGTSV